MTLALTLFEKIWNAHEIEQYADGSSLLWVDRHIVNEGSSLQAFAELSERGIPVARPEMNLAVADHVVPTIGRSKPLPPGRNRDLIESLDRNAKASGIPYIPVLDRNQGICHVIAPELGFILPGMVAVCGDSHTSTLGGLGALAFGIGTSEVAHVLATGTIIANRPRSMAVRIDGQLADGVTAKDMALSVVGMIGTAGATGCAIEFCGSAVSALEIEGRLTLCNMAIEAGARSGLVAPDEKTLAYLKGRPLVPEADEWDTAAAAFTQLRTDPGARYDHEVTIDAAQIAPQVTWGTSPQDVVAVDGCVPDPAGFDDPERAAAARRALAYQGLEAGRPVAGIGIDFAFIGSCTNARMSDLREAARIVRGKHVASAVTAIVVPGSTAVKQRAEAEGLDKVFLEAGFEWRDSACSLCCGAEAAPIGARVAATSNRNFEHRQGRDVRTHLASPATVAASAIAGHLVDIRTFEKG